MPKQIPDRWLDYKPIGRPIRGTNLIAFKVPLSATANRNVKNAESRLEISDLLEKIPNLGMVIDLTNTSKYYSPQAFGNEGIKHVKLMIPGRQIPEKLHIKRFLQCVNEFLNIERNAEKLVGIHCTHGVNRTGFFICHYMISCLKMPPADAIRAFEEARGHTIERENYRDFLIRLKDNRNIENESSNNRSWKNSSQRSPHWRTVPKEDNSRRHRHNQKRRRSPSPPPSWNSYKILNSSRRSSRPDLLPSNDADITYTMPYRRHNDGERNHFRDRYSWRRPN